jgi:polyferredoxin
MGIVSALSPVKIRRDAQACIDCGKCSKACPSHLPVGRLVQIRSVECTGCMECIAVCPAQNALQLSLPPRGASAPASKAAAARWRNRVPEPRMIAVILAVVFFAAVGTARITGHWQTNIPHEVYMQLVPEPDLHSH